ncbi:MAG TPA: MBL fold metallo-hydrolase [Candidatus Anoxymicrobiaceae bacterium]
MEDNNNRPPRGITGERAIDIGDIKVTPFVSSRFRLDGGSMFGVVPRVLWERKATPDSMNRIDLNSNSLLIETGGLKVLLEPGMGSKYDAKQSELYALGDGDVIKELARLGVKPEDIDLVLATHLHLDHAGGTTASDGSHGARPSFPNAKLVVQLEELKAALEPHALSKGSYRQDDFVPLVDNGALMTVEGDVEVAPGVFVEMTGGHTPGHQIVRIDSGGQEAVYPGDLVPTCAHLRLNWLMAWDLDPRAVYAHKGRLLADCAEREALLFWSHDPCVAGCRIKTSQAGYYEIDEESVLEANR